MKKVYLLSLIDETWGAGSAVYIAHLYRCLEAKGYAPVLCRVGARVERSTRPFTHGLLAQTISLEAAKHLASSEQCFIPYAHAQTHAHERDELIRARVPIAVHDVTEIDEPMVRLLKAPGAPPVAVIRRWGVGALAKHGVPATFIRHPFVRTVRGAPPTYPTPFGSTEGRGNPVCACRIDYRKHQEIVIAANKLLPANLQVFLHGPEFRQFVHFILDKRHPDWRRWLRAPFRDEAGAFDLLQSALVSVDLTVIGGPKTATSEDDGDGTQYTFLEAWNAGTPLIVHKRWIKTGKDAVRHGETAWAVETPEELAQAIERLATDHELRAKLVQGGMNELEQHGPDAIVPLYEQLWRQ